ncbi:MAG: guanylate kinase [Bacteroidetes bacterium]|nr:guanylate kinase [Bacteroidota bacterium]
MTGKLIIVSAPSGAGKTTIIKQLLKQDFRLEFSVSACSRKMRAGEKHGVDYYFMSAGEFRNKIAADEFLEWEEVYTDHLYGTLKSEVDRIWNKGNNVIFDVDVKGGINIKKYYGKEALSLFIMPPSVEELEKRLRSRSTDSDKDIKTRIDKAKEEISRSGSFDRIIINDDLDTAIREAIETVGNFLQQ